MKYYFIDITMLNIRSNSIIPAQLFTLQAKSCVVNSRGGATPMQVELIKLDLDKNSIFASCVMAYAIHQLCYVLYINKQQIIKCF